MTGDIIKFNRGTYIHYGIDVGAGRCTNFSVNVKEWHIPPIPIGPQEVRLDEWLTLLNDVGVDFRGLQHDLRGIWKKWDKTKKLFWARQGTGAFREAFDDWPPAVNTLVAYHVALRWDDPMLREALSDSPLVDVMKDIEERGRL